MEGTQKQVDAMKALGGNVVLKRAERRISQSDLASRARVARQTTSKIESGRGNVTVEVLEKIAAVLRCGVDELFRSETATVGVAELRRRAKARGEFVSARALLSAIDDANEVRYSQAGRPRTVRRNPSAK